MAGLMTYKRLIPANSATKVSARGTAIIIKDSVGPLEITARCNQTGPKDGRAYTIEMRRHEKWFSPEEFDEVDVRNNTSEDQRIEVFIGYGDYVLPPVAVNVSDIFRTHPAQEVVEDEGGAQLIVQSNLTRRKVTIFVPIESPYGITIGGTKEEAERLTEIGSTDYADCVIAPGFGVDLEVRGEVWAYLYNPESDNDPSPAIVQTFEEMNNA